MILAVNCNKVNTRVSKIFQNVLTIGHKESIIFSIMTNSHFFDNIERRKFMHKLTKAICKYRKIILVISLLLLIPSILGMKATKINYDILSYLPENVETVKGENILSSDFDMGAFSIIILENMKTKDIIKLEEKIKELDNVEKAISIADVARYKFSTGNVAR